MKPLNVCNRIYPKNTTSNVGFVSDVEMKNRKLPKQSSHHHQCHWWCICSYLLILSRTKSLTDPSGSFTTHLHYIIDKGCQIRWRRTIFLVANQDNLHVCSTNQIPHLEIGNAMKFNSSLPVVPHQDENSKLFFSFLLLLARTQKSTLVDNPTRRLPDHTTTTTSPSVSLPWNIFF